MDLMNNVLQTIKPVHISTVRKLAKPPSLIMRIMDCVLILFQKKIEPYSVDPEKGGPKTSWSESLKVMFDKNETGVGGKNRLLSKYISLLN